MRTKKIWFAIVGIKPLKGNKIISNSNGAHVNVACISDTKTNFKRKLQEIFKYHKCEIFQILDIETEDNLTIINKNNSEKIILMNEINEGYQFAWGTFYTFD